MQSRNSSSGEPGLGDNKQERLGNISRKPQRISITVSQSVHEALGEESFAQGRSLSNLASFWLERQAELTRRRANG